MPTFPLEPVCLENWLYHAVREVVQVKRPANCIGKHPAGCILGLDGIIGCEKSSMPTRGAEVSAAMTSTPPASGGVAPILLFNGTGTSPGDVAALEKILSSEHLNYSTINSPQLIGTSESQLREYRLLIVPGGNFVQIGNSLTSTTTANIHNAVQNGLNFLGVCAGAFFAGNSPYHGLNLTAGARFGFYAAEARGIRKAPVPVTAVGGQALDQYWEDGPQLTGWGAVVGKYPDGTSAIAEGTFGNGWVILTGFIPRPRRVGGAA